MIHYIIFDLGQVLVKVNLQPFFIRFSKAFNISQADLTKNQNDGAHKDFMIGNLTGEQFHKITCEKFDHFIPIEEFREIWVSMIVGQFDGTAEIVHKLYENQYHLALLSNTDPWHYEYCAQNFPILQKFERIFLSYKLKKKKPDPDIFLTVVKALNATPEQCLLIDDTIENIHSAESINFKAIHFKDAEQLRCALIESGIKVS